MRYSCPLMVLLAAVSASAVSAQIRDVLKRKEIDAMFSLTTRDRAVHEMPNYAIWFQVRSGKPGPAELHRNADAILFVRRGNATVSLGGELAEAKESAPGEFLGAGIRRARAHAVGAGDVVHIPRGTPHRIDPGSGRFEYAVVRVFPTGDNLPHQTGSLAPRHMPELVKSSQIDATIASFDTNQPLHGAKNYTINYVIYKGRSGPWEAHRGCVDIYFIRAGTGRAELGGEISNAKEETPGEIRGDGVKGARVYEIGPGDMVVIPRHGAHHVTPLGEKLGYLLVKVWAE